MTEGLGANGTGLVGGEYAEPNGDDIASRGGGALMDAEDTGAAGGAYRAWREATCCA